MNSRTKLSFSLLVILLFRSCNSSSDTITTSKPVRDGETIESNGKIFALGFFSPGSSKNRYVGIWYAQVSQQTVIWVANRESPISDRSGSLEINNHGNILINRNNGTVPIWSSNVAENGKSSSVAQLLDSGNLRLFDNVTGRVLWQSFDHPTDCILPSMKLGLTRKDGLNRFLTNWKSPEDPGLGDYSFRINPSGFPQVFFYKGLNPRWRVGSWTGKALSGIPEMRPNYIFSVAFVDNKDEVSTTYTVSDTSLLVNQVINETGIHLRFMSTPKDKAWNGYWSAPKEKCDNYSQCGLNGYCSMVGLDNAATSKCTCLPGFEPKSPRQWSSGDGSGGCLRKRGPACHEGEGFVKLEGVKVPDTSEAQVDMDIGLTACREKCLGNCSCVAYSNAYFESDNGGIGCLLWHGDLLDMRTYAGAGQDFFVRVDAAEMARLNKDASAGKRRTAVIAVACVAAALLVAALVVWIIRRKRRRESQRLDNLPLAFASSGPFFDDSLHGENRENTDLPFLPLSTVAEATSNFSSDNKLGHGGFGSVYKGVLPNGMEIAVKRLSKHSGQGIEEFKTEIVLIAKLQHRNLVKILGCCTEGEEKMLIYEYLPNRSLDSFIFDKEKKLQMDWTRRFEIICGIARGIMYLHEDSRLRIIHRDLKASNILLDAVMIPKISDFGMARIFNRDQIEGSTNRVVGTYGYMSPEYAMDGQFSIKSDVYSFGVLLLEIITGRRNSGFYHESPASNLIGHVWELWGEDKAEEIIDKAICETGGAGEILRCMQIGLLCVQESASDRPTMSSVVFMLGNVSIEVPYPKRPAFIVRRKVEDNASLVWSNEPACSSGVDLSITEIHAR